VRDPSHTAKAICEGFAVENPAGIGLVITTAQPCAVLTPFPFDVALAAGVSVPGPSAIISSTG
jgi:hypothetical protein